MLIFPVESFAAEPTTEMAVSEDAGKKTEEEKDKKEEEIEADPSGDEQTEEETEKTEEVEEEKEEFHFNDEQRKKLVDEKFDDAKINDLENQARIESKKDGFDADKFIDDAINKNKVEDESAADEETNTEAEKEQVEKDKSQEKTIEESTDKKDPPLEVGDKNVGNRVQATPEDGKNTEENAPGTKDALTEVDVKITKKGIGDKPFNFDGVFGNGAKKKVKLINEATKEEQVAEFGSEEELVKYLKKIKMADVVKDDVYIEFEGGNVAGKFTFKESAAKPDDKTGKTSFELTLWQIKNTDIEVKTKNKAGDDVANPTTGKIQSGDKEIDIPSQGEVGVIDEDAEDLAPNQIDEYNKKTPKYNLTNKESGFLVDRDGNKVYKQNGEVEVDPDGLNPSKLNLTEKPLVTTEDQPGDEDYVKVTFNPGEHGTIKGNTEYNVIAGVDVGENLSDPQVKGNDDWEFKKWNDSVKKIHNSNVTYTAVYEKKITETIKAKVKYVADDSLAYGTKEVEKAPVDGEKEVTTVSETGKKDEVTEKVTKQPVDGVTKVGNKQVETTTNDDGSTTEKTTIYEVDPETGELTNPTTTEKTTKKTTEKVPGKVKYVADDSLDFEEKKVEKAPVDGEKEVTTVSETGKDDVVTENIITPAEDGVTKVGNKKVETKTNEDGSTTETTTIYDVDPDTGDLSNPTVTNEKTTKKTTEKVPGKVKYVADDSLDFEEKKVEKAPVDGEKEVTTVSETGKDDVVTENIITPAEDGVTKVGNKKVETKTNEDGSTTETTTIYDVDPDTGDLSNPTVTT
ncbi:surface rod structure-forming protein G, partial [Finegoldia magna]